MRGEPGGRFVVKRRDAIEPEGAGMAGESLGRGGIEREEPLEIEGA